jgi:hypothetical protein
MEAENKTTCYLLSCIDEEELHRSCADVSHIIGDGGKVRMKVGRKTVQSYNNTLRPYSDLPHLTSIVLQPRISFLLALLAAWRMRLQ